MKVNKVLIRKGTRSDLPIIQPIFSEFVKFHTERDPSFRKVPDHADLFAKYLDEQMKRPDSIVYVAEIDGRLVGYCLAMIRNKPPVYEQPLYGYIDNIAVLEECQKQGIGSALYTYVSEWFRSNKISRIELMAAATNEKSIGFWNKVGFRPFMIGMFKEAAE